ncbi:MAG: hypothetical protein U0228_06420 [Myxococcaceae bacterium]
MSALAASLLFLIAAAPGSDEFKLGMSRFNVVGQPAEKAQLFSEHLATRLLERGVRVATPKDLEAVMGFERQKELLGCKDEACLLELAGAIGVKELITGEVAKLDDGYQVVVKVLVAQNGKARLAKSRTVSTERQVFLVLDEWSWAIAGQAPPSRSLAPLIPMGLGVGLAGVGVGFVISANLTLASLQRRGPDALSYADAMLAAQTGPRDQWLGVGFLAGGAVALAVGALWFALAPSPLEAPSAWLVPVPGGLALGGAW